MSNNIDIVWDSRDTAVLKTLQAVEMGFNRIDNRMNRLEQSSRKTASVASSIGSAWKSVGTSIAGALGAFVGINAIIGSIMEANRKFARETEQAGRNFDSHFRSFGLLTGLRGEKLDAARERIVKIAQDVPISDDANRFAAAAAKQLASSGFSNEESSGAALREFLSIMAASDIAENPEDMVRAVSQFLAANNMEKNAANLRRVGRGIQRLSLTSDTGISDLSALAKESASFSKQLSFEEQAASFMVLRAAMPGEAAATAIRNVVGRLTTASASGGKVKALEALGLSPEDVDFINEDVLTVLGRLKKGLDGVSEEQRAPILKKLFEEQGVASTQILLSNIETIRKTIKEVGDDSAFGEQVRFATSGRNAAERRQTAAREARRFTADNIEDLLGAAVAAELESQGFDPGDFVVGETIREAARALGIGSRDSRMRGNIPIVAADDTLDRAKVRAAQDAGFDPRAMRLLFSEEELRELQRQGYALPDFSGEPGTGNLPSNFGAGGNFVEKPGMGNGPPLQAPPPDGQTRGAPATRDETAMWHHQNQILDRQTAALEQIARNTGIGAGPTKAHRNKPPSSRLSRGQGGVVIG